MEVRALSAPLCALLLVIPGSSATLTHDYLLNDSLADSLGGPSLIASGGTVSTNGYSFGAEQGLSVADVFKNDADYSILLRYKFTQFSGALGYNKLIDFTNLQGIGSVDPGLYVTKDGALNYWNGPTSTNPPSPPMSPNTFYDVVLTRDASTKQVTGYVDGLQYITFTDNSYKVRATLTKPTYPVWFFMDDHIRHVLEAAPGVVTRIEIWDGVLTASQVGTLRAGDNRTLATLASPEPSSFLPLAFLLLALPLGRSWRRGLRRSTVVAGKASRLSYAAGEARPKG